MKINKKLVGRASAILILLAAFLLPVLGQDPPTATAQQRVVITNNQRLYSTLNIVECLDWSWATPEQKYRSGSNGWGKWRPRNGEEGEVVFITAHCDSKVKLYIVKIGQYYVPMGEAGVRVVASDGSSPSKTADDHMKLGDECYSKKDLACAIANYTRAVELAPESWLAYYLRGKSFAESGKPADATADYTRAIGIFTNLISVKPDAESLSRRAFLYAKRSGTDDASLALADCTQAIKIDPAFAFAYQVRAAVYRYLKRIPEAESDERKAKELQPK